MSDNKELKTSAFTMKVTESFKTDLENFAIYVGKSQSAILVMAFNEYVRIIRESRVDRMKAIGAGGHHAGEAYKILVDKMNYSGLQALFDPDCFDDNELLEIIHNKVSVKS